MNSARELDIGVIAEGVETAEQRRVLAAAVALCGAFLDGVVSSETTGTVLAHALARSEAPE